MISETIIKAYSEKTNTPMAVSIFLHKKLETFFKNVVASEKPIFPTKDIDEAWHCFILNTKSYYNYCMSHFGKFIHHTPMKAPEGFADCSADCYGTDGGDD